MKSTTKLLNLLTAFLAVIGVCAATLVCFIVAYTQINGGFSPKRTTDYNAVVAQADNNTVGAFSFSTDLNDNFVSESLSDTNVLNNNNAEPISLTANQTSNEIYEPPTHEYDANPTYSETDYAVNTETSYTSDSVIYAMPIEQETFTTPPIEQSVQNDIYSYEIPIGSSNQIANDSITTDNNFNTYNNPEQQQTSDMFVLNTSTFKFHRPNCNDVKKIAPENYSTSNLSISELENQGYSACGHCFG